MASGFKLVGELHVTRVAILVVLGRKDTLESGMTLVMIAHIHAVSKSLAASRIWTDFHFKVIIGQLWLHPLGWIARGVASLHMLYNGVICVAIGIGFVMSAAIKAATKLHPLVVLIKQVFYHVGSELESGLAPFQ